LKSTGKLFTGEEKPV
jgi:hypothetical protein